MGHNIQAVVKDIQEVQEDLKEKPTKEMRRSMMALRLQMDDYILDDPNTTGGLLKSTDDDAEFVDGSIEGYVSAGGPQAPEAPFTEFGTGFLTEMPYEISESIPGAWPDTGSAVPLGYPFDSPDMAHPPQGDYDVKEGSEFASLVGSIENWMRKKTGVQPYTGSYYMSAIDISRQIVRAGTYAHPFMRPAWFDMELVIKKNLNRSIKDAFR